MRLERITHRWRRALRRRAAPMMHQADIWSVSWGDIEGQLDDGRRGIGAPRAEEGGWGSPPGHGTDGPPQRPAIEAPIRDEDEEERWRLSA